MEAAVELWRVSPQPEGQFAESHAHVSSVTFVTRDGVWGPRTRPP